MAVIGGIRFDAMHEMDTVLGDGVGDLGILQTSLRLVDFLDSQGMSFRSQRYRPKVSASFNYETGRDEECTDFCSV